MDHNVAEQKYIKGSLLHYVFHNEENLYTVARIRVRETNENYEDKDVIITGYMPQIYEQETYFFYGHFVEHPKYGKQYRVINQKRELPKSRSGIIQYLSSDLFEGIGKKTAEAIIDLLGERAISKILNDRTVLNDVPYLSEERAQKLYDTLKEHEGLERIMIALSDFGFGPKLSMKIYQAYKEETIDIIEANPYQLIYDVEGIGFKRADELGKNFGLTGAHPERIRAGSLFCLHEKCLQEGHAFLDYDLFVVDVKALLDGEELIDANMIARELVYLDEEGQLILDKEKVYMPSLYYAEKGLVTSVKRQLKNKENSRKYCEDEIETLLDKHGESLQIKYSPTQKKAIKTALNSPIMILTGGPGTGKTTIIQGIVQAFSELNGLSLNESHYSEDGDFPVVLAAPTGRAAKRMTEATELQAYTIHRLLGWKGETFDHNEDEPIQGQLLIIDEFSMVDLWLANHLFKSIPHDMQVILVGDEDQLPSVQPGQVLKDLLESNVVPTVKLETIYRQSEGSSIIQFAHEIKKGELPHDFEVATEDHRFFPCRIEDVSDVVAQIATHAVKKGFSVSDIQVLAPMYKGKAGVEKLNIRLQSLFNPQSEQKREIHYQETTYRTGDKVLQLINDSENQVFNGDIGIIEGIIYAKENHEREDQVIVSFEGIEVTYTRNTLQSLTLAYCCSIHKAQGSEFPIVILPFVKGFYRMLRRNLLYTAITRSKQYLLLCGEKEAFEIAIDNAREDVRNSQLREKLAALIDG